MECTVVNSGGAREGKLGQLEQLGKKEEEGKDGNTYNKSDSNSTMNRPLHEVNDCLFLSDMFCFLRHHIEAFVYVASDYCATTHHRDHLPGRVGLRCIHCHRQSQHRSQAKSGSSSAGGTESSSRGTSALVGSVTFPSSIRLVYQTVRNMQRYHFQSCPSMPADVRAEYEALREGKPQRSRKKAAGYWEECCLNMGMVDVPAIEESEVPPMILLRNGRFENGQGSDDSDDGENSEQVRPASEHSSSSCCHQTDATLHREQQGDEQHFLSLEHDQVSAATSKSIGPLLSITTLSNEAVLDKVRLALSAVEAVGQISLAHLPSSANVVDDNGVLSQGEHDSKREDISFLGSELYEMFINDVPGLDDDHSNGTNKEESANGSHENDDYDDSIPHQQQSKREKCLGAATGYVPLSELGMPPALCLLVSSLLKVDPRSSYSDSDRNGGRDQDHDCVYATIKDVEDDLRLILSEKEKFLFRHREDAYIDTGATSLNFARNPCYGREKEIEEIMRAFNRTADTNISATGSAISNRIREVVLISGDSGVGKSCLVQNVSCRFVGGGACFVSGKFDAMLQPKPLSAIVSSVDKYCAILANDDERMPKVRKAVSSVITSEGRVVLRGLMPNIVELLDPMEGRGNSSGTFTPPAPPVAHANGAEALRRLIFMIRALFRVTCSRSHPVVIFLDDLQWADETSLLLMNALITDTTIEGLLFIGSYRDNEVTADHPLRIRISDLDRMGFAKITSLHLDNLDVRTVESLLSDTLCLTPLMVRHLAQAVWQKTAGNALFVVQFISALHDEGLLRFSLVTKRWEWDIEKVRQKQITSSVAKLMMDKILRMAPEVLEALKVASCFGAECEEAVLHIIDRAPDRIGDTAAALDIAVSEGIMSKVNSLYRFSHDQIQQAAYQLVPDLVNKAALHLLIGKLLWKWASKDEFNMFLFVLVDQLHRGSCLLTDPDEKVELARLSLLAGEMAHSLSAFLPASSYLETGCLLLTETDWECHRKLCFSLLNLFAETQYVVGDFASVAKVVKTVLSRANELSEKLSVYHTLVLSFGAQGHVSDAIRTLLSVVNLLGENLSLNTSQEAMKKEIGKTMQLLSMQTEESMLNMKAMNDTDKLKVMKFLHLLLFYMFTARSKCFPVVVCRVVQISLSHGVCKESALGFAAYGIILCGPVNMFRLGYRYGTLALNIIERFEAKEYAAKVLCSVWGAINPTVEPVQSVLPPLKNAVEVGLAAGDTAHAMVCAITHDSIAFASGKSLSPLVAEMQLHRKQMVECKQNSLALNNKILYQTALNLMGMSADPTKLDWEETTENGYLKTDCDSARDMLFVSSRRMWLEYIFGKYELAWQTAESNKEIWGRNTQAIFVVPCHNTLFLCLTALALARKEGAVRYTATIKNTFSQMKVWAEASPWNFQNKLELMKAEYAYLKGDNTFAAECYQLSIDLAIKHHFIHEQAIALERAGLFYLENGEHNTAIQRFERACNCYRQWGAEAKVSHVQSQYIGESVEPQVTVPTKLDPK